MASVSSFTHVLHAEIPYHPKLEVSQDTGCSSLQ